LNEAYARYVHMKNSLVSYLTLQQFTCVHDIVHYSDEYGSLYKRTTERHLQ